MAFEDNMKVPQQLALHPRWHRTGAVLLCLQLTACAAVSNTGGNAPAPAVATPPSRVTTVAAPIPDLQQQGADAQQLADEINRAGRVIQLGRFTETPPVVTPPTNDVVELNYEQEDLRVVLEQLGNALSLNMVIDPTIDSRVSLRTAPNNPLRYADIWPLMRLLAANAGIGIEQAGNVYQFTRSAANIPAEIVLPSTLGDATLGRVLQVTPLTYVSVEAVETILQPLLQPEGGVIRLGPANLIGINGTPAQLTRINALLAVIDDDPFLNQGIQLYPLQNSQASTVAEELQQVLTLVEGELSSYQVLGLERINAVLVVAPANRGFDEVTRWVNILDAQSQEQVEQLFVYRVKNLTATTLGATLTQIFGVPDQDRQATAAQPLQPLITRLTADGQVTTGGPFAAAVAADAGVAENAAGTAVSANLSVTIVADEDTNTLLIRATPREYRQLLTTLGSMDSVPAQVLINAVIGQVTLTESTQFGIDWTRVSGNAGSGPGRLSTRFLPGGLLDASGLPAVGSGLVLTRTFMDGSAVVDATLNAIAQDNEVTLLARPTLLTANNQEGEIKVGQRVPVNLGVTVGIGGVQTANIQYQDVGITLTITPKINDDGFVNLSIYQELSSVQEASGGVENNPTFTSQEITTTVVVSDQSTITLGGLIQDDALNNNTGVPFLQRIPVLGSLFSYQQLRTDRRELFIILRPQIIRGDGSDNAALQDYRNSFTNVSNLLREAGL
jgi:general secretion pathway protein D